LGGYDSSHTLLTNKQASGDKKKFVTIEKNDTYEKIAQNIAKKLDIKPITDPTTKYRSRMLKNDVNYIEFLKESAKKVGFEFFITRGNLYFVNPRRVYRDKDPEGIGKILKFEWHVNLLEFVPTLNLSGLIPEVEIRGNLSPSKELVVEHAETGKETMVEQNSDKRLTGSQIAKKMGLNRKEIKNMIFDSRQEAKDIAMGQLNIASDNLVTSSGSIIGNPELMPGQHIEIAGISKQLSGLYYVTEVTNTIDSNGYSTKFNARKNNILMEK
jgi:phage protein D